MGSSAGESAAHETGAARVLPEFENPPVTEVIIGLQFHPLPILPAHVGDIWAPFREKFPVAEQRAPLPPQVENFSEPVPSPGIQFQLLNAPILPLGVFQTDDRARAIQLQSDRFICAWRRTSKEDVYPRYSALRAMFVERASSFSDVCTTLGLPDISVIQAELTYVNDLPWRNPSDVFERLAQHGHLEPEDVRLHERYQFTRADATPYARLHIAVEPVAFDGTRRLRLALTFRGEPFLRNAVSGEPFETIMSFLDEGHEQIILNFDAATTEAMHAEWGKR